MYSVSLNSNATDIVQLLLQDLMHLESELPQMLTGAALDHVAVVKQRIQNQGQGSRGQSLITKAAKRLGAYSKAYSRRRSKYGRQTQQVDFTFDGSLMRDFQVMPAQVTPDGTVIVEAGFTSEASGKIAGYLEDYFGPAFFPSETEQQVIAAGMSEALNRKIHG